VMGRENPSQPAVNHHDAQFNPRPVALPWGVNNVCVCH